MINTLKRYAENFKHQLIEGDIEKVKAKSLTNVDITAGFPCQAFSIEAIKKDLQTQGVIYFLKL